MADLLLFLYNIGRVFRNVFRGECNINPKRCSFCGVWMEKVKDKRRSYKCPECDYEVIICTWLTDDDGGGVAPGFK